MAVDSAGRARTRTVDRAAVGSQLIQLSQVIVRLEEMALNRKLKLSYRHMRILKHVNAGVTSATDLARIFGITPAAISETLGALVQKRLLTRQPHPSDRRSVVLVLTELGAELHRKSQAAERALAGQLLDVLDDEAVTRLGELLGLMLEPNQQRLIDQRHSRR